MLLKRTVVDQKEIRPDGTIQLRFAKQIVEDDEVTASEWHRTVLPPSVKDLNGDWQATDVELLLTLCSADLVKMKYPALSIEDFASIKDLAAHVWTADVVSAYRQKQDKVEAAQAAAMEAPQPPAEG